MPRAFEFRLEKLLDLRRLKEDLAQRDHAEAQRAVQEQNRAILGLLQEEDASKQEVRALKLKAPDVVQLRLQEGYLLSLERRLRKAYEVLHARAQVEAERRRVLTEARKGVRVLERFREKQLKLWRAGVDLEERRFLDDVTQQQIFREEPVRTSARESASGEPSAAPVAADSFGSVQGKAE